MDDGPFKDRDFIVNGSWEVCCLKQRPKEGEKPATLYRAFGVLLNSRCPLTIYLRGMGGEPDFKFTKKYESVDALLADGWIVD